MTIVKPILDKKNKNFIIFLFSVILIFGILYIYTYNILANARYQETQLKNKISSALTSQNELKDQLFAITDPKNFEFLAQKYNLVYNNKPEYFILHKWVSEQTF